MKIKIHKVILGLMIFLALPLITVKPLMAQVYIVTDLGTLGGPQGMSTANRMNDLGDVTGMSDVDPYYIHGYLWTKEDGMVDLGTLGGPNQSVFAYGINNQRQIVGSSVNPSMHYHAFLWEKRSYERPWGTWNDKYFDG